MQSLGEAGRRHTAGAGSNAAAGGAPSEPGRVLSTPSGDISMPTSSLNPAPQQILAEVRARQGRVGGENGSADGVGAEDGELSREQIEARLGIAKPAAGEASSSKKDGQPRKGRPLRKVRGGGLAYRSDCTVL